ncbi:copper chaperone PCu(A)C [Polaromonas sp. YR568]|uniref:copper chaperone PCu(A)C n=1 Tax=Polaromonas sp. YR568 TaxID=1855301 RepID=UPI0031382D99
MTLKLLPSVRTLVSCATFLLGCAATHAQTTAAVDVSQAWVRATGPGQMATGGFMHLTARTTLQLVAVSTPAAGVAEVHEMKMEGDIMKMRAVKALELPAGKTVELKPGGYHLMLMDLKQPFAKGSTVPVTLHFRDTKGVASHLDLKVAVGSAAPAGAAHKH